jgi:hypothetical protein
VLETARTSVGTLAMRGPMVPTLRVDQPLPVASEVDGYVDTGFPCRHEQVDRTLIVTGPPADIIDVGGYCLRLSQVDALVSRANTDATIVALPDGDLAHRLAGSAPDRKALQGLLKTEGVNPLIVGAFDQQGTPEAA